MASNRLSSVKDYYEGDRALFHGQFLLGESFVSLSCLRTSLYLVFFLTYFYVGMRRILAFGSFANLECSPLDLYINLRMNRKRAVFLDLSFGVD